MPNSMLTQKLPNVIIFHQLAMGVVFGSHSFMLSLQTFGFGLGGLLTRWCQQHKWVLILVKYIYWTWYVLPKASQCEPLILPA